MGSLIQNSYSWIQTNLIANGASWVVKWTNDTREKRILKTLTGKCGTVNGTCKQYETGASATGHGQTIELQLRAVVGSNEKLSQVCHINKVIGTVAWSGGITSAVKKEGQPFVFGFLPEGVEVDPGETVQFFLANPSPMGAVLGIIFNGMTDEEILPDINQPIVAGLKMTYDANGGKIRLDDGTLLAMYVENAVSGEAYTVAGFPMLYDSEEGAGFAEFQGWSSTEDGDVEYRPGQNITPTDNMTFYAVWEKPSYTVRFYNGSQLWNEQKGIPYGGSATKPPDPSRGNKAFAGWDKDYTHVVSDMNIQAVFAGGSIWIKLPTDWEQYTPYSETDEISGEEYSSML